MTTPSSLGANTLGDANDLNLVQEAEATANGFAELGVTGLRRSAGYVDEEFLPQLKGQKAIKIYREMADNDAIIGALLFSIMQLIRNVTWTVTPAGKSKDDAHAAQFIETCMDDMSHSWQDMILEVLSCLTYGWSLHEIIYKRRMGPWNRDAKHRSKYDDGLIGWRKMPIRSQETLQRWAFDETGDVQGMIQLGAPDYQQRTIPIEKALLFRYSHYKGSPEGRSMLRNAYRSWFYKKRIEEFESIGIERDLAGLPKVGVPASYLSAKPGSVQAKQVEQMKKMVRGIRRNEQEGIVFPLAYDQDSKKELFTFDLVGSGGQRQFQTRQIIDAYATDMLMTVLADFIKLGHQSSGTYNMHVDKTGIFKTALNAICNDIADVFNRHAIPRLFALNGWKPNELPKITPSDVDAPDLTQLGGFLTQTAGLGFTWNDADMERFLRNAAGLPELSDDDFKQHRVVSRKEEATRFAKTQTNYLAARSALAQQMAASRMQESGEPAMGDVQEHMAMQQGVQSAQQGQESHDTQQAAAQQQQQSAQLGQAQQIQGLLNPDQGSTPPKKKAAKK